jgi:hypothetical protein
MPYLQEEQTSKAMLMMQDDAGIGSLLVEAILQETSFQLKYC